MFHIIYNCNVADVIFLLKFKKWENNSQDLARLAHEQDMDTDKEAILTNVKTLKQNLSG